MHDYRYNPFSNALEPIAITGETHIIPTNSPFTIRLCEVPLKESPSTVSLTIGGVAGVEVAAEPAAGEFRCDYTTGADQDDNWNTGLIQFNAADAGKTVVVAYNGMGTLASVNLPIHSQLFTASGMFTVPPFVEKVYISGCGGGGGGGGGGYNEGSYYYGGGGGGGASCYKSKLTVIPGQSYAITIGAAGTAGGSASSGGAGGASSFGSLLTLGGGGAGLYSSTGGAAGGAAGGNGGSAGGMAGLAGGTHYGSGGNINNGDVGNVGSGYGSGGAGGYYQKAGAAGKPGFILVEW